jgi:beta-aspartyl-dipeptidase (metallo-type)
MPLLEVRDTALLIRNVELYTPRALGRCEVLVVAGRVLAIASTIDPGHSLPLRCLDAGGRLLVPGLVDSLVHIGGGGGEGGFATRAPPLGADAALRAGVTTVIGALGTDEVTRGHADLLACARGLTQAGVSAYVLSGSYRVPVATLTGSLRSDLVLIPEMIGVGEIAIADHRGSQPTLDELARIGADARVGGMLAGKRGTVLVHVGDAAEGLSLLHALSTRTPLPASGWHPTHINRNRLLLAQASAWSACGGSVDLTASTTPQLLAEGEVPAAQALVELLGSGVPIGQITLSSDGQASLPQFDADGRLVAIEFAAIDSLLNSLRQAVHQHGLSLATALAAITSSPADIWGLPRKGRIEVGADADMLLLERDSLELAATIAAGSLHVYDAADLRDQFA